MLSSFFIKNIFYDRKYVATYLMKVGLGELSHVEQLFYE